MKNRKLKESKTFKKPRVYMRDYFGEKKILQRLRIIYPDGRAEWADGDYSGGNWDMKIYPCWHVNYYYDCTKIVGNQSLMTAKAAVRAMKAYDKAKGFNTIYLGEF